MKTRRPAANISSPTTSPGPPMTPAQPVKTEVPHPGDSGQAQGKVPFDQLLRRLVDAQAKKPAPKPGKPPRKL